MKRLLESVSLSFLSKFAHIKVVHARIHYFCRNVNFGDLAA